MSNDKAKPVTPYQRLLDSFLRFRSSVDFPSRKLMWTYPKNKLADGWRLDGLYERAKAADQLGYDVVVIAADDGLRVQYRSRPDHNQLPWSMR